MKAKDHQNPESVVRDIKRKTRRKFSSEEKIRIILEGLKGEESIATICRREGIASTLYISGARHFWRRANAGYKGIRSGRQAVMKLQIFAKRMNN